MRRKPSAAGRSAAWCQRRVYLTRPADRPADYRAIVDGRQTQFNKEAVNRAFETTLAEGHFERRLLRASFASEDQKEGMQAFVQKRKPLWKHR